jgi:YggT family protein
VIILGNFLIALGNLLSFVLGFLIFVVIGRAIISWVSPDPYNPIVRFLTLSTEPFLRPLRRVIPMVGSGIDLTPLVLLALVYFLQSFLAQTILDYGVRLKAGAMFIP